MIGFASQAVVVTGAGGFIGANLCRRLIDEGATVHALVHGETPQWRLEGIRGTIQIHAVDIADAGRLRRVITEIEPQTVFHLAAGIQHARTAAERATAVQASVVGTSHLLDTLVSSPQTRLVHVGSSLEYAPGSTPLAETSPIDPVTFRGAVKAGASILSRQFAREHDRDVVILRPFSVYGPWESGHRFIPAALMSAFDDRELPLTRRGYSHDFVFVDDVVEACLRAATLAAPRGEVLNVGSGRQWTNEGVATLIRETLRLPLRVKPDAYPSRPVDTEHWVADMQKTERLLGWRPTTELPGGLEITARWLRSNRHLYEGS